MLINLTERNHTISRPLFKILLCDDESFVNPIELNGIFDTGADITFLEESFLSKFKFGAEIRKDADSSLVQTLYVGYIKIPELSDGVERILFGKRTLHNSKIPQIAPDLLMGRDFLRGCILTFDGPNLRLEIIKPLPNNQ